MTNSHQMISIGLIGCGRIGRVHAANIDRLPDARLATVFDVNAASAAEVAALHGVPVAHSAEAVFAAPGIDAVLIASATDTHAEFIEQAVAAGKPVFCEKPIDLDLRRVNRCALAVQSSGVAVQLGFNRRFDHGHRAARDALRAGEIGELRQVVITSRDPAPPPRGYLESAGGLFRDMTIHDFDLARFMLVSEPVEVFVFAGALVDTQLDELNEVDTAMVLLRTAGGVQVHINNSRASACGYDQRVELVGSQGVLLSDNCRPHELRRFNASGTAMAAPFAHFFLERYGQAFAAEIAAFVHCVRTGDAPPVGFEDGRRALVLAEAATRSAGERRVVHIDEVSGP